MSLVTGAKLGPYEIVALLSAGGMGEVCRRVSQLSFFEFVSGEQSGRKLQFYQ